MAANIPPSPVPKYPGTGPDISGAKRTISVELYRQALFRRPQQMRRLHRQTFWIPHRVSYRFVLEAQDRSTAEAAKTRVGAGLKTAPIVTYVSHHCQSRNHSHNDKTRT